MILGLLLGSFSFKLRPFVPVSSQATARCTLAEKALQNATSEVLLMVVFVVSSIACFDWLRPNFLRWCLPRIVGIAGSGQPPQRMLTQITKIPSES